MLVKLCIFMQTVRWKIRTEFSGIDNFNKMYKVQNRYFSGVWLISFISTFGKINSELLNSHIPVDHGICAEWASLENSLNGNCSWTGSTLKCFGSMDNFHELLKDSSSKIKTTEEIIFCGWPNATFDAPFLLNSFHFIRRLRIEHGQLTHINNDFPELYHLESVNISWTNLKYTRPTLFKRLRQLKHLDLRWNRLDHMEGPLLVSAKFEDLHLAGNPWNCTNNLKWFLNDTKSIYVADRELLRCADVKYNGRPVVTVMHYKVVSCSMLTGEIFEECSLLQMKVLKDACLDNEELRNCSCTMSFIRLSDDGNSLQPLYLINCSSLNFYNLPSSVPENTTIFYASDNKISNVEALKTVYRSVQDIYLDFNAIQSIDILDTEYWLQHFRVFSLKGNKLTKIPVYAIDNALEKNKNVAQMFLSHNPWRCDCLFTMRFQELLRKYNTVIKDASDVTCKYIEGDDNFGAPVLSLTRSDVCQLLTEYKIEPFDLLNCVLSSLIILVLGKLGYDYYHYRKSGRLPWIARKMP